MLTFIQHLQLLLDNMAREVLFSGSSSPLSNMYMAGITWNGKLFKSTEYAYQYEKLMFHGFQEKAEEILSEKTGFLVKEQSKIKVATDWLDRRTEVMRSLLFTKFHLVGSYRSAVLSSGIFKENTMDSFWGVGTDARKGKNTLGQLHMELRASITDRVLIIGTSHTRQMDTYMHELLLQGNHHTKCDVVCMPGGLVHRVKARILQEDLSIYTTILVICGGNNLFDRQGNICTPPKQLALQLQDLQDYLTRTYPGSIIVIAPVFPRRVASIPTVYPLPSSHFVKRNKLTKYVNKMSSPSFSIPEFCI